MAKKQKGLGDYMAVGAYSAVLIFRNISFVLFLGFLGVVYIANAHYSEKKVREIQSLQDEIKELRWRYMAARADLMYSLKESEVAKTVKPLGLKPIKGKMKKVYVEKAP